MGFRYNGVHSDAMGIIATGIHRDILPPIAHRMISVPGRPGAYWQGYEYGVREITIDVVIRGGINFQTRIRDLASWLNPDGGPKPLVFDDEPEKEYRAIISERTEVERVAIVGRGTLTFLCPEPFAYGAPKQAKFTVTENGQIMDIENTGTIETPIQIIITNTGATPINGLTLTLIKHE